AELVERGVELLGVPVDTEGAGPGELVLAVAAREHADGEHPGAPRREQIPDRVADHVALRRLGSEAPRTLEEEIRFRFRAPHVAALDDRRLRADVEHLQRGVDLRPTA